MLAREYDNIVDAALQKTARSRRDIQVTGAALDLRFIVALTEADI